MLTRSKAIITSSVVLLAASQSAISEPNINGVVIEKVGYAGNGCPAGSASAVLARDKKSITLQFDDFVVQAGGHGQRTFARAKCDVAFGLKVPAGISVSLLNADYQGFNEIPSLSKATFTRNYFFAGARGPRLKKTWTGEHSNSFQIKDSLGTYANEWSRCGADVILRSKTALTVRTKRGHEALIAMGSRNCFAPPPAVRYYFRFKSC